MSLDQLVSQLEAAVSAGNLEGGKAALNQAKILVLTTDNAALAAQALECGVLLSLAEGDLEAVGRYMSLLLPYYMNDSIAANSLKRKNHILGLHLMHLLVEHRLSEFHSILEIVSEQDAAQSKFLSYPIGLERQLMVGMYDEILQTPIPDPSYQFFVDHSLQQTVRDSIADGLEVSYQSLSLKDAAQMMKFNTVQELKDYIADYRDDWIVEGDVVTFSPVDMTLTATDIAAQDWIQQSLQYATEMERIV